MFNRRDFIRNTSVTAMLTAFGQVPLWAATKTGECYAVQGFAKFLKTYVPPKTLAGKSDYKLINITKEYGRLKIARVGAGVYLCNYSIEPGNSCEARFELNGNLLGGVHSWELVSYTNTESKAIESLSSYAETGEVRNGQAVVKVGKTTSSQFATNLPLLPDWLLPLAVSILPDESSDYEFSLLREGTYFLGGQRLFYDGMVKILVQGGQVLDLKNYLHIGKGTLPTNYLVNADGVTLIVTRGITAWVLSEGLNDNHFGYLKSIQKSLQTV